MPRDTHKQLDSWYTFCLVVCGEADCSCTNPHGSKPDDKYATHILHYKAEITMLPVSEMSLSLYNPTLQCSFTPPNLFQYSEMVCSVVSHLASSDTAGDFNSAWTPSPPSTSTGLLYPLQCTCASMCALVLCLDHCAAESTGQVWPPASLPVVLVPCASAWGTTPAAASWLSSCCTSWKRLSV